MKTYKEQADELIKFYIFLTEKNYLRRKIMIGKQIETLIQAGEYFITKMNWKNDIKEIQESINKLKEAIK